MKPEYLKQVSICKCINKGSTHTCFMEIIFAKLDVYLAYLLAGRSKTNFAVGDVYTVFENLTASSWQHELYITIKQHTCQFSRKHCNIYRGPNLPVGSRLAGSNKALGANDVKAFTPWAISILRVVYTSKASPIPQRFILLLPVKTNSAQELFAL